MPNKIHEGRNVKRIREIMGIKQDALATDLGISQQAISQLEQRETIDPDLLQKVAQALKVPEDAIRNFSEETVMSNISCNFSDNSIAFQVNPVEKIIELYESLLKAEREKVALLEKMLGKQ